MIDPIWSWWLTAFAVTAIWVGPSNRWGWIVGAIGQCLWFAYGIHSHQHGFVVSALLLAAGYIRNFVNASKKRVRFARIRRSSSPWGIVQAERIRTRRRSSAQPKRQQTLMRSLPARQMLLMMALLLVA